MVARRPEVILRTIDDGLAASPPPSRSPEKATALSKMPSFVSTSICLKLVTEVSKSNFGCL